MADIKSNEREFMSQVTSWLNEFLKDGSYPFEVASSDPSIKVSEKKTKFPDVQVWLSRKAHQGFCGWELKTPATPVDDQELLNNAAEKARAMHADYFVTWNMRDAVIWRTPNWTEEVSRVHRLKTYVPISQITNPDDLWVVSKQELLKARAKEILNDLSNLHREGHLHLIDVDSTFFVHELSEAVKTLWPHIHKSLITEIGKSAAFQNELFNWAVKQGIATYEAGEAFFETVSRQIIYRLFGKILFYLTLRRFRSDIPRLDLHEVNPEKVGKKLKEYFEIARQIDYQAVFEEDFPDKVPFPQSGVEPLTNLLDNLNRYNFSHMPQDVVGNVFEKLIPPEERHALGQYFTNEELVDLITAFCVRSVSDKILDPTCGTGTFLIRAYDRLRNAGEKDHKKLLSQIWGIDIAHFPAELATINLYRQNIEDYANFPRVISKDFFEVKPDDTFKFPPPKPSGGADFMIDEKILLFDGIVGNFPYIRQELIEKRIKGYKGKLTKILAQDWRQDYPELFNNGDLKLSGQADIYAYLFFHTAKHLKDDGRMGIVTSNAWLDVAYGYELQKFFLKNFKIVAILESRCEPWFEDAAVNTIVTILERCKDKEQKDDNNVKFVKIKKRLKELIPWDIKLPMQRWLGLDKLIHSIENAGAEYYKLKGTKFVNTLKGHTTYEDDNFRIRVANQGDLLDKVTESGKTVKWGQYLRAPEIYFEILEKCKDKLVSLNTVADIRRGYTTGINEFFYLDEEKIRHWGIEEEFLAPVIKSPKEATGILLKSKDVQYKVFLCNKSKKDLRKEKKLGALTYIEWGEKQKTKEGVSWTEVPTVSGRKLWYDLGERQPGKILLQMITNDRFFAPYNADNVQVDHNLFELFPNKGDYSFGLGIYLNSSVLALFRELISRVNLGEGATKTEGIDWKDILTPKKDILSSLSRQKKLLEALQHRNIKSIFEEVKMKDRQALDSAVLEALGLDPKKYLKPLYDGLTEMVRERIDLAKSRKKVKQVKTKRDIEKLKEQVVEEIIPDGVKKFPEEFIDSKYLKDAREISVPNEPLKLGAYFIGQQEVVSESGFKYDAANLEEAKFIIYAQKPNSFLIRIPKQASVVIRAVDDYERYIKDLKAKLFEAFFSRTHDHKQADTLVQQVFEEVGLPEI
ncbi:MAG: SAM-dependent methyltransferase [Nitrospirae bacterium]|nr:SAM-dependent methyltransferase [Nitrospirota bacterium]MCL5062838.1 SAM-dependent methyltransferase [Nitrospirota bacterium]MDA8339883.1 N-6 DNA methylase [Nitrospiraceae bacterium]